MASGRDVWGRYYCWYIADFQEGKFSRCNRGAEAFTSCCSVADKLLAVDEAEN